MKKYKEYMDSVRASDILHQRLVGLEASGKRSVPWARYGTVAAALVLVCGLGAWGLSRGGWDALAENFGPDANAEPGITDVDVPEIADALQPDIASAAPGDVTEPGMKTIGGYEVTDGGMVSHYILPYIEYGLPSSASADYSLTPPDGGLRGATVNDALALVGGKDALSAHLDWGGCEFDGSVGFEADGTVWMMSLWGESEEFAFSLELSPDRMPPSCVVLPEDAYTWTEVWGVKVAGIRGGAHGDMERGVYMDVGRQVQFLANGTGCRLKVYGTQDERVEEIVSRFVRYAVLEGLNLSSINPDGAKPLDTAPNYSVGEPNYKDGVGDYDPDCPYCADGTPHTHPYDPNEAADPSYNAPGTYICEVCGNSVREGGIHFHVIPNGDGAYTCDSCGVTLLEGERHYHTADDAMCSGYPVPEIGETHVCLICGEVLAIDIEHSHEVCGLPLAPPNIATDTIAD